MSIWYINVLYRSYMNESRGCPIWKLLDALSDLVDLYIWFTLQFTALSWACFPQILTWLWLKIQIESLWIVSLSFICFAEVIITWSNFYTVTLASINLLHQAIVTIQKFLGGNGHFGCSPRTVCRSVIIRHSVKWRLFILADLFKINCWNVIWHVFM